MSYSAVEKLDANPLSAFLIGWFNEQGYNYTVDVIGTVEKPLFKLSDLMKIAGDNPSHMSAIVTKKYSTPVGKYCIQVAVGKKQGRPPYYLTEDGFFRYILSRRKSTEIIEKVQTQLINSLIQYRQSVIDANALNHQINANIAKIQIQEYKNKIEELKLVAKNDLETESDLNEKITKLEVDRENHQQVANSIQDIKNIELADLVYNQRMAKLAAGLGTAYSIRFAPYEGITKFHHFIEYCMVVYNATCDHKWMKKIENVSEFSEYVSYDSLHIAAHHCLNLGNFDIAQKTLIVDLQTRMIMIELNKKYSEESEIIKKIGSQTVFLSYDDYKKTNFNLANRKYTTTNEFDGCVIDPKMGEVPDDGDVFCIVVSKMDAQNNMEATAKIIKNILKVCPIVHSELLEKIVNDSLIGIISFGKIAKFMHIEWHELFSAAIVKESKQFTKDNFSGTEDAYQKYRYIMDRSNSATIDTTRIQEWIDAKKNGLACAEESEIYSSLYFSNMI